MHPPKDDACPVCSTKYDTKYVSIQYKSDTKYVIQYKYDTIPAQSGCAIDIVVRIHQSCLSQAALEVRRIAWCPIVTTLGFKFQAVSQRGLTSERSGRGRGIRLRVR